MHPSKGPQVALYSQCVPRDLRMICHIWPPDSDLSFKATFFFYWRRQTNLSRWDELAISNWPPLELLSWTFHGELSASGIFESLAKKAQPSVFANCLLSCQMHGLLINRVQWPVLKHPSFFSLFWLGFAFSVTLIWSLGPNRKLLCLLILFGLARLLHDHILLVIDFYDWNAIVCSI